MRSDRHRSPMVVAAVGLAVVALVGAGVVGAVALLPEPVPEALATPMVGGQRLAVMAETYDGAHMVAATSQLAVDQVLRVAATGRVTVTGCVPGEMVASGKSPLSVGGQPVVALATAQPLFRDLAQGAKGADVLGLQQELARLGYQVSADGVFGAGTRNAVKALLTSVGVVKPMGVLSAAAVVWLPEPSVLVASCEVQVGDWVVSGDQFAQLAGTLRSLKLANPPGEGWDGWIVRYRDLTAPIGADVVVSDATFLAAVEAGPEFASQQTNPGSGDMQFEVALAKALQVVVVPPSAIIATASGSGCVVSGGEAIPVRIVASSLGQTMVATADGTVPASVEVHPDAAAGCS